MGEEGVELIIPGGRGRGPRKTIVSKLWSCAVCCRIVCLRLDICCRKATVKNNSQLLFIHRHRPLNNPYLDRRERMPQTQDLTRAHSPTTSETMSGREAVVGRRRS